MKFLQSLFGKSVKKLKPTMKKKVGGKRKSKKSVMHTKTKKRSSKKARKSRRMKGGELKFSELSSPSDEEMKEEFAGHEMKEEFAGHKMEGGSKKKGKKAVKGMDSTGLTTAVVLAASNFGGPGAKGKKSMKSKSYGKK
jgi:hypothetical protein